VGYADPASRKTTSQLDADTKKAETRTNNTEERIADREKDLKALTTK